MLKARLPLYMIFLVDFKLYKVKNYTRKLVLSTESFTKRPELNKHPDNII